MASAWLDWPEVGFEARRCAHNPLGAIGAPVIDQRLVPLVVLAELLVDE